MCCDSIIILSTDEEELAGSTYLILDSLTEESRISKITITSASLDDAGIFSCKGKTDFGSDEDSVNITVLSKYMMLQISQGW